MSGPPRIVPRDADKDYWRCEVGLLALLHSNAYRNLMSLLDHWRSNPKIPEEDIPKYSWAARDYMKTLGYAYKSHETWRKRQKEFWAAVLEDYYATRK